MTDIKIDLPLPLAHFTNSMEGVGFNFLECQAFFNSTEYSELPPYNQTALRLEYIDLLAKGYQGIQTLSTDNSITVVFPAGKFYESTPAITEFSLSEDQQRFDYSFQARIGCGGLQRIDDMQQIFRCCSIDDMYPSLQSTFCGAVERSVVGTPAQRNLLIQQIKSCQL